MCIVRKAWGLYQPAILNRDTSMDTNAPDMMDIGALRTDSNQSDNHCFSVIYFHCDKAERYSPHHQGRWQRYSSKCIFKMLIWCLYWKERHAAG